MASLAFFLLVQAADRLARLGFRVGVPIGMLLGLYWGYMGIMEKKMEATLLCRVWGLGSGGLSKRVNN